MVRGSHWWNEPPLWAWIVMVVGLVALAVMLPLGLNREAPAGEAAASGPRSTPSSTATATPTTAAPATSAAPGPDAAARVVVIGDGYTSGTAQGGLGPDGWPALVEDRLATDVDADVDVTADVGAGFVATGASGLTFGGLAGTADLAAADVVVVLGSRDDGPGISDQVAAAAEELLAGVGQQAPEAALVVVGPVWPEDPAPAGARNNRDVIREAAAAVGATFVDPIEDAWLVDEPELLGPDGVYPTDAGHAYLADRLEPAVRSALGG